MIFKKPYMIFIKLFKPIHIMLSIGVAYLIYLDSNILSFLNTYISSRTNLVEENVRDILINKFIYIIPIIIIVFSLIILGIMFRNKKPIAFYLINIFAYIAILVVSLYTDNFLGVLEHSVVSIRVVKLIHDLVLISMIIEGISFAIFVVRGMGINFKKFNFDSDISKFDISENEKEEFELEITHDIDETKRKRKKKFRNLKYKYLENKFKINILISIVFIIIVSFIFIITSLKNSNYKKEGNVYYINGISIGVDDSIILNTDYSGKKITDNYLIVVNCKIKSNSRNDKVSLSDFSLQIGKSIFKPTTKYSNYLTDIGNVYDESLLKLDYVNYLFVYEIPEESTNKNIVFNYNVGNKLSVKLNPRKLIYNDISISKNIGEYIDFKDSIGDINFKIDDYEIKEQFKFNYNYCIKKDDCIMSIEYIKPSIDKNFDKVILRLNVDYNDNTDRIKSFYKLFSMYGIINYNIGGNWYSQNGAFEEIKSSKVNAKNNVYIGVNSNIIIADSIKLVFNIRGSRYEYVLK